MHAPIIVSLRTSGGAVSPETPLTVTAVVTDPDGIDDLIGGELVDSASGAAYGVFATAAAEGAYSLEVTWFAANVIAPLDAPPEGLERGATARFFDQGGATAEAAVPIPFRCDDDAAACDGSCSGEVRCGSSCVSLDSPDNCGRCGRACTDYGTAGYSAYCSDGDCVWSGYSTSRVTCESVCATGGGHCAAAEARYCPGGGCADWTYRAVACLSVPAASVDEYGVEYLFNLIDCTCHADGGACASGPESTAAACSDGCSNDGDVYIDCDDYDCCAVRDDCPADTACG